MIEQQKRSQSPGALSERNDSTYSDTADRIVTTAPAAVEIDLGIDPVAYHYESWSEMADGWIDSVRSTAQTMPDSNHEQIRNVTPLVPLSDVEALVEQRIQSREAIMPHERTDADATEDTSPP